MEKNHPNLKDFVEREFNEFVEGEYDDQGFFNTPNGSFWDPDGVYFNREGFDKHGGYYDDNNEYQPGEGWDETKNCYIDEINDYDYDDEYGSDHDDDEDDGFGDIDMDKIQDEELLIKIWKALKKKNMSRINMEIILKKKLNILNKIRKKKKMIKKKILKKKKKIKKKKRKKKKMKNQVNYIYYQKEMKIKRKRQRKKVKVKEK